MCASELYEDVEWKNTAVNTEDIEQCPPNFEVTNKTEGSIRVFEMQHSIWCQVRSESVSKNDDMSCRLKLGYESGKPSSIFQNLKDFINNRKLKHCEGEAVVQFVRKVCDYLQNTKPEKSELQSHAETMLDILSAILDHPNSVNKQSKHKLEKEQINAIDKLPVWLTDKVSVTFDSAPFKADLNLSKTQTYVADCVITVFYKNLALFLPKRFLVRREASETSFQLHSRLLTVALFYNQFISNIYGPKVTLFLNHHNIADTRDHLWKIACGIADFGDRIGFRTQHCETKIAHWSSSVTTCVCNLTGTYVLVLTSRAKHFTEMFYNNHDLTGIVGCAICTLFVLLSLVILVAESRCSINAIRSLKIQVCIALIGCNFSFIATLYPMVPNFQNHMYSLFLFFQMAVFSLQICFCAIIYSKIAHVSYTSVQQPECKLTFIGWVIPVSVEAATLAAQAVRGFPSNQWSLQYGTTYFYGTIITTGLMFTFHLFLYATIRVEFIRRRRVETTENIARIKAATAILNQSLVINCIFESAIIATISYVNIRNELLKQIFVASYVALGLFILICYSFCIYHDSKLTASCVIASENDKQKDVIYEMNHLHVNNASSQQIPNHAFQ
ncbi:uncharacterized protein B4U80_08925 [Leptotrombidium deliense]|uniref:Uncharacterized protein n=1 Tax=Leptotrombidium deliense TaxID=299467 RepID=A0A443SCB7_9ACAR|nr:uncharacterized protein B4U80_08925 [Leptotrombidium deliense]